MTAPQTISEFLDTLLFELRDREPRTARRVLAETEDHLREAAAARVAAGDDEAAAEAAAIAAFGRPGALAAAYPAQRLPPGTQPIPLAALARQFILFAGLVLVAVGVSGVILLVMGEVGGARFAVNSNSATAPAGSCVYEVPPGAILELPDPRFDPACQPFDVLRAVRAYRHHAFVEAVTLRLGLGVTGIACFALLWVSRGWGRSAPAGVAATAPFAAGAVALISAGVFLFMGRDHDVKSMDGAGWYYSAGLAAVFLLIVSLGQVLATARGPRSRGQGTPGGEAAL